MKIAYTMSTGRGDTDELLLELADRLTGYGWRLGGIVQINTERDYDGPCDMDVKVLPEGPILRISQNLGQNSRGCRLDASALETSVGLAEAGLAKGIDCLIINKFGKQEADGRGFRDVIANALADDIPVLVGLNHLNQDAFDTYTAGLAVQLDGNISALESWFIEHLNGQCQRKRA
ncbi:DUF2478 domain-containing protein [uncultured Aliiroseovarius sp.]|uniref:DUF2478 domain-containing protein n=1 Tax=uncultured Aliiroseovarius sp. TaxID=1658783 RepID=UPI002636CD25|nr:DUF2478 domain-containing protein [uncultured Aliiroseovarius sp.]